MGTTLDVGRGSREKAASVAEPVVEPVAEPAARDLVVAELVAWVA